MHHDLKTWPEFFRAIERGDKTFEVRQDDRGFNEGDDLILREWSPGPEGGGQYTGGIILAEVTYVMRAFNAVRQGPTLANKGLMAGYVVMGMRVNFVKRFSPNRGIIRLVLGKQTPVHGAEAWENMPMVGVQIVDLDQ